MGEFGVSRSIAVLVGCLLVACSGGGTPSAGDAEAAVRQELTDWLDGAVELTGLEKVDGQQLEMFGAQGYRLDFKGAGRVSKDVFAQSMLSSNGIRQWTTLPTEMAQTVRMKPLLSAGQQVELFGTVGFAKKESGWVAADVSVDFRD
jgi:hypothetical protein